MQKTSKDIKKVLIIPLGILVLAFTAGGFYLSSNGAFTVWHAVLLTILTLCPTLLFPLSGMLPGKKIKRILHRLAETIIGSYLYLLILLLLDAVVCYFSYLTGLFTINFTLMIVATLLALIVLRIYGGLNARKLRRIEYHIDIPSNCPGSYHAVLFSDLHLGYFTTKGLLYRLRDAVIKENADAVFIAGDLFDNDYDEIKEEETAIEALSAISEKYPIYFCRGNHDSYGIDDPRTALFYQKAGITLLADERLELPLFTLYGRRDRHEGTLSKYAARKTAEEILDGSHKKPIIILDHNPADAAHLLKSGADLVLCGHTHNGQTFPGNIASKLMSKFSYGHQQQHGGHAVTTAGVGYWGPPLRIGTANEIVVLNIQFVTK